MKFVIGSGQSNAVGGDGSEGGDLTPNTRVKVWNGSAWATATPGVSPFYPTEPGKLPRNNVFWNFCKRLQEETNEDVYFVLSGLGETPISEWAAPSGQQWVNLDTAVKAALATEQLSGRTSPDYFLWFHGGADTGNTNYRADFLALRAAAISSGWLTTTTPIICGEIKADNEAKAATIELLNDPISHAWMGYASNANIPRPKGIPHPTGDGCVTFGRNRFYNAAMNIPRRNPAVYKPWTPILIAEPSPTIVYAETETYGGSYLSGGIVHAWFKIKLSSIARGAGPLYIGGLPYTPSPSAPGLGGYSHTAIATDVSGLNFNDPMPLAMRTAGENGLRLFRVTPSGTQSLNRANITEKFTMAGSLIYPID